LEELPNLPLAAPPEEEGVSIKKRSGQTRFLTPVPDDDPPPEDTAPGRRNLSRDLSLLYRLALDMGSATTPEELARSVLDGLLEAVPAEVVAILTLTADRE